MDTTQLIQVLMSSPVALVLLWMLVQTQKELTQVRQQRDADTRDWMGKYIELADRVAAAVERLDLPGPK